MKKLKVAILEDSKELLNDLKRTLEKTELVEVVVWASSSLEFLNKMQQCEIDKNSPEAMILDIDLLGDSMTGIDIANMIKLPVLFVSGKIRDFYTDIETLNLSSNESIEFITKPVNLDKLSKILPKFISEISLRKEAKVTSPAKTVSLKLHTEGTKKINVSDIVLITSKGQDSGNKEIYFLNRKPAIIIDFTIRDIARYGLDQNDFITISKQEIVHKSNAKYDRVQKCVAVKVTTIKSELEVKSLKVSEDFESRVKKELSHL
jgi:DNA-binding response OmpR family regulator